MGVDKEQLLIDLKNNVIEVVFTKADGTLRTMRCTLDRMIVPPDEGDKKAKDYKSLSTAQMINYCADNPNRWAEALAEIGTQSNDKDAMTIWFTNVIEATRIHDTRARDSSVIRVWEIGNGWRSFDTKRVQSAQLVMG